MSRYSQLGLNNNLIADSSVANQPAPILGIEFDLQYEVQAKKLRSGQSQIKSFVLNKSGGSVLGTLTNNSNLSVTTTIAFNIPRQNEIIFALPLVSAYLGTAVVTANQIYPIYGNSIANGSYSCQSGYNYPSGNGTNLAFSLNLENKSGATGTFLFQVDWRHLDYAIGTAS